MEYNEYRRLVKRVRINDFRRKLKSRAVKHKGGACCICGYDKSLDALQFHHTDKNQKDFALSRAYSWEVIVQELEKCILVCSNCHHEIHGVQWIENTEQMRKTVREMRERMKETRICTDCGTEFRISPERKSTTCPKCRARTAKKRSVANKIPEQKELATLVWEMSVEQLSKKLKCSPTTIRRYCKKMDINMPPKSFWSTTENRSKIDWPSDQKLLELVSTRPLIHLAKEFGVSDNAIRKRCKARNIKLPPPGYWIRKGR
jgi:hypothetical protein